MCTNVIETIGSLSELKAYCCPRVAHMKDWHLTCVDCKGRSGCPCGKRAVELVNKETRPKKRGGMNSWCEEEAKKARVNFEKSLQSGDPINWIITNNKSTRSRALEQLRKWCSKYPDILKKHPEWTWDFKTKVNAAR